MRCNLAGGMGTGGAFASHGFLCSGLERMLASPAQGAMSQRQRV